LGAALWYVWYLTAVEISNIKPLKSFDPFQILGVEVDADQATIKRAYRKLSLLKHPDKNPDDPLAVTEFIQITKAYTALTDETARANWEKYGNPDGPGTFHVAIALPRFLLQKENNVMVLSIFFMVLLVVIPFFFY
jgi:translocation protein SEC63